MKETKELTAKMATRRLGISLDALYRLIYAAKLPARKDQDGRLHIPSDAVEARRKARMKLRSNYRRQPSSSLVCS
jgi:predicted site-specific integrase-resolvase